MSLKKYDVVCKKCYDADKFHAPYETILAKSVGQAKSKYIQIHKESEFTKILVRICKRGSFN
jgi:hypothetical protein